jgi:hypothetical protein
MNERDDELIIQNHPHADQRNWQPGDDDAEPELLSKETFATIARPKVLRTLKRLRGLATHLHPEDVADILFPHVPVAQIVEASLYLEKVAACIDKKMREGKWKCAECGQDVWAKIDLTKDGLTRELRHVRRDAHYCSQACRAKAFRNAQAQARCGYSIRYEGKAVTRNGSTVAESGLAVTASLPDQAVEFRVPQGAASNRGARSRRQPENLAEAKHIPSSIAGDAGQLPPLVVRTRRRGFRRVAPRSEGCAVRSQRHDI